MGRIHPYLCVFLPEAALVVQHHHRLDRVLRGCGPDSAHDAQHPSCLYCSEHSIGSHSVGLSQSSATPCPDCSRTTRLVVENGHSQLHGGNSHWLCQIV